MNPLDFHLTENVLRAFGLDRLDETKQADAIKELGDIMFQKVVLRLSEELDEQKQDALDMAIKTEESEPGSILTFLRENVSDFGAIVNEEVAQFKEELSDLARSVKD